MSSIKKIVMFAMPYVKYCSKKFQQKILLFLKKKHILHYNTNAPFWYGGKGGSFSLVLNTDSSKPIYIQIAEWLETEILRGNLKENEKVYSQYKLAEMFNINPATAAKGLNILAEEKVLYDKRGIGKFVASEAKKYIKEKRKNETLKGLIQELIIEAAYLQISEEELINMVKETKKEMKGEAN